MAGFFNSEALAKLSTLIGSQEDYKMIKHLTKMFLIYLLMKLVSLRV